MTKLSVWINVVVTIVCWLTMALMVFFQENEDVYRNPKIFGETVP